MIKPINLRKKLSLFSGYFDPKIIGELNGQLVKLAKFRGEFVWHSHEQEDELFFVVSGSFEMLFRDHAAVVEEGEMIIVPRGVEHCPRADDEVHVMLFEPASTINTGQAGGDRTVAHPERL